MPQIVTEYPQFFTATNLEWQKLLKPDKYEDIIISSMRFLVKNKRVKIFSFIIMENHIHLIWQMMPGNDPEAVQRDFPFPAMSTLRFLSRVCPWLCVKAGDTALL